MLRGWLTDHHVVSRKHLRSYLLANKNSHDQVLADLLRREQLVLHLQVQLHHVPSMRMPCDEVLLLDLQALRPEMYVNTLTMTLIARIVGE